MADQSVEELVQRAEHAITTLQPELAVKFYERAREVAPEDTSVMDALGELLLTLGEEERAFEVRHSQGRRGSAYMLLFPSLHPK